MAVADTTRLLVLGLVQLFGPANGYQLRRELLSWEVESWANINPGSIYSMLTTLTKLGLVERIDLDAADGGRAVAIYRTTSTGSEEFFRAVRSAISCVPAFERTEFYAGMSFVPMLKREDVIALLEERERNLHASLAGQQEKVDAITGGIGVPPHVAPLMEFGIGQARAEIAWVRAFIERARAGDLMFDGDEHMDVFRPADDDPAQRMMRERAEYLERLAARDRG